MRDVTLYVCFLLSGTGATCLYIVQSEVDRVGAVRERR